MPSLNTKLATAPNTTSNFVLRATSSTTIGNSTIQDDGTNVAIGTTPGTYKLNVSGTGNFTGALSGTSATFSGNVGVNSTIRPTGQTDPTSGVGMELFYRAADTSSYIQSYDRTNSAWKDVRIYGNTLYFGSQGTNNLTIASTGAATFSGFISVSGQYVQIANASNPSLYLSNTSVQWQVYNKTSNNNFAISDAVRDVLTLGYNGSASFFQGCNVGIGTSSPTAITNYTTLDIRGVNGSAIYLGQTSTPSLRFFGEGVDAYMDNSSTGALIFRTTSSGTERMRITSGGSVGINNTNPFGLSSSLVAISGSATSFNLLNIQDTVNATSGGFIQFLSSTASVFGSITRSGATSAVLYNTTSDYRLKEDLQEIKGLEKVCAIKVYDFKWIENEYRMDGVLAHELAEVLPYAVNGEKDALNEDGSMKTQGVDYSKIVPILIKSIQELEARIKQLENK